MNLSNFYVDLSFNDFTFKKKILFLTVNTNAV